MKTIDNSRFESLLKTVARMTEDNLHSEALDEIALFFDYIEFSTMFGYYSKKESLRMKDFNTRCEVADRMFIIIGVEYGKEVVERIKKAL